MVENTKNIEVPFSYRKHFTPEECVAMVNSFKNYDKDKSGKIDKSEFK